MAKMGNCGKNKKHIQNFGQEISKGKWKIVTEGVRRINMEVHP